MNRLKELVIKRQAWLFPILDVSLNVVNYLIHIFLSWYLFSEDYGVLSALLALLAILMVCGISFQIYVADKVSEKIWKKNDLQEIFNLGIIVSLVIVLSMLFMTFFLKQLLRCNVISILIVSLIFSFNLMTSIQRGVMQGNKNFLKLNMSFYIEVGIRLVMTIILMKIYSHYDMALLAILLGMIASYIYGYYSVLKLNKLKFKNIEIIKLNKSIRTKFGKILKVFFANFYLYYFTSLGMIIVNYYLIAYSGIYGITTKISQLSIKIGFSLITVLIPFISRKKDEPKEFKKLVNTAIFVFLILSVIGLGLIYLFTPWFVESVFNVSYQNAIQYVFKDSIANVFLMNAYLLIIVEIVLDNKKYLKNLFITAVILTTGMLFYHQNIEQIIYIQLIAYIYLFISLIIKHLNRRIEMNKNIEKKQILFLSWRDIKAPKKGGAEVYTHEMLKGCTNLDYDIVHISPEYEGCKTDEIIDGIRYLRMGSIWSVIGKSRKYYKLNREKIEFVIDQCNTHRFFTPFWVEKEKRIFFIHQFTREIWFRHTKFPFNHIGFRMENWMTKLYKKNITMTVSNSTKNDLLDLGFQKEKIYILPEGIDFIPWNWEQFEAKNIPEAFLYVGRFAKYKGINDALEAFGQLKKTYPNIKMWIVGKKKEEYINSELIPIMNKYSLTYDDDLKERDVTFFGFVSDEMKLKLMSSAKAHVFPSLREGWGLTVTEAAAVGTPSIVYNSPGLRDAVNGGMAGYMTNENSVDDLLKNMEKILEDDKYYNEIRLSAYEFSEQFNWSNTAIAFENMIDQIGGKQGDD